MSHENLPKSNHELLPLDITNEGKFRRLLVGPSGQERTEQKSSPCCTHELLLSVIGNQKGQPQSVSDEHRRQRQTPAASHSGQRCPSRCITQPEALAVSKREH